MLDKTKEKISKVLHVTKPCHIFAAHKQFEVAFLDLATVLECGFFYFIIMALFANFSYWKNPYVLETNPRPAGMCWPGPCVVFHISNYYSTLVNVSVEKHASIRTGQGQFQSSVGPDPDGWKKYVKIRRRE